ncbi:MAG: tetratricopeptide repeat protein [Armatimonadota bacterium]
MSSTLETVLQIRHVPGSDPPQFTVVRLSDGRSGEAVAISSPAEVLVAGTSSLLAELRWYLESFLEYPFPPETERAERVLAALKVWGEAAFIALFDQRQTGGWMAAATAQGEEQLLLQISSDDPAVLAWPWEALRDPAAPGALAHACRIERRLNRNLQNPRPADLPGDAVNILLVTARPYERDVHYRSVSRPLVELIEKECLPARVTVLRPPTFAALQSHLRERRWHYHILHFDGHGAYNEYPSGSVSPHKLGSPEGRLVFETEAGDPDPVEAERLSTLLREVAVPVVVLNACQSGMMGPDAPDPFASVAAGLLQGGVHAVVAMAYSLYVSGAQQFLPAFYRRLFESGDVAEAVRTGRRGMLSENRRTSPRGKYPLDDWLVPVLYRQGPFNFGFAREAAVPPREERLPEEVREIDDPAKYPYGFIGRDSALLALERALRRLAAGVLIQGLAGVGKTTLARGFCAWLAQTGGLNDGCLWLGFQEIRSAEYVINRMGEPFFGPQFGAAPLEERFARLVAVLRERRVIIVWDNFEVAHGIEGTETTPNLPPEDQELLARLLAALRGGASKVLITSRSPEDWLGPQRRFIVPLGGLDGEERWEYCAAILHDFGLQARQDDPRLVNLMNQLSGHPLAMRVVLSRLDRMNPEQVLDALQTNLAAFQAEEDAEVARLYATLRFATVALPVADRALLVPLALHEGFVNADHLEMMATQIDPAWLRPRIDRVLAALATAGLLRDLGQAIYEMHPLFTSYLRNHTSSDTSALHNAWESEFVAMMGRLADSMVRSPLQEQYRMFHMHEANFHYALEVAARLGMDIDFVAITQSLAIFAQGTRRFPEAERLYSQLIQYSYKLGDPTLESVAYQNIGGITLKCRDFAAAEEWYKKALVINSRLGDEKETASIYLQFGNIAQECLNFVAADEWYRKSLAISEKLGDEYSAATVYHNLGVIAQRRRDFIAAEKWYKKTMTIKEKQDDEDSASIYHQLGLLAEERRNFAAAEEWYRKSLAVKEKQGDEIGVAIAYHHLGNIAEEHRDFAAAEEWYRKSVLICEKLGDEFSAAMAYHQLGNVALVRQDFAAAEEWYRKSLAIKEKMGNKHGAALTYHNLGVISEERRNFVAAEEWYRKSLLIREELGDEHGAALIHHQLGILAFYQQNYEQAGEWLTNGIQVLLRFDDLNQVKTCLKNFVILYKQAPFDMQQKLRVIWQEAGLGSFPEWEGGES